MRLLPTLALPLLSSLAAAQNVLRSTSLNTCQEKSGFEASKFDVVFTPNNNSVAVDMASSSTIVGNVVFDLAVSAYGYQIIRTTVDPCKIGLNGFCPMQTGPSTPPPFALSIPASATSQLPSIAFQFPDLDATVKVFINRTGTGESLACLEAGVSNSKTVDLAGVKWAAALVIGLALLASAIISGLGHANAASHIAANAVSLCSYFQAQATVGLAGVPLPPAAQAWTQDFQWSIGIIKVDFLQKAFTWYQRATGGTPARLFDTLAHVSVQVSKRSLSVIKPVLNIAKRVVPTSIVEHLQRRGNIMNDSGSYVVTGIQRVAYRSTIESTNLFMTGLISFMLALTFAALAVVICKGLCELAARMKWMKGDTFLDFRNGWRTVLKGVLYRITLLGYPAITLLCFWEFTQNDSAAEMILAVFFLIYTTAALGWAGFKVIQIARRSVTLHRTPAYILFSDPQSLNKWGFLYIPFRASAYYYIIPILGYFLLKGMFIGFGQGSGIAQAIGLILIEAGALIAASVLRPWMDKKLNTFNISIAVVNFLNAICLLIFTNTFGQPALVNGIVGVVFWLLNAITTLILLIFCIVTTAFVFFRENPDGRYRFMSDERASFMKSTHSLSAADQLDALATTARGEKHHGLDLDDGVDESSTSLPLRHGEHPASRNSWRSSRSRPHPTVPFGGDVHQGTPLIFGNEGHHGGGVSGPPSPAYRAQHNTSPWQRGAGYDH